MLRETHFKNGVSVLTSTSMSNETNEACFLMGLCLVVGFLCLVVGFSGA